MGRPKNGISDLGHDALIHHLFEVFNLIERQRVLGQFRRKTNEMAGGAIDPRTVKSARSGEGIAKKSAGKIADALSKKIVELIDGGTGKEEFLEILRQSHSLGEAIRLFHWLEKRLEKGPPYIYQDDLILNRDNRHLIDDYRISLSVAPNPRGVVEIERSDDEEPIKHDYQTVAFVRYMTRFSAHNRNSQTDFSVRYHTKKGRLEVMEPSIGALTNHQAYRSHRSEAWITPNPKSHDDQKLSMFVYGGYDAGEEGAHFSFIQNALYRRITFALDLSSYPKNALLEEPVLFLVPKLPGEDFLCCTLARQGKGREIPPTRHDGRLMVWRFEGIENLMIGVHWKINCDELPQGIREDREKMIEAVEDSKIEVLLNTSKSKAEGDVTSPLT